MDTKKIAATFAILMIALGVAGFAYAHWSESIYLDGYISTGTLDVVWTVGDAWDTEPPEKDFSYITGYLVGDALWVDVMDAYPCIDYYLEIDIENVGTIPVHIYDITWDLTGLPLGTTVEILPDPKHPDDPMIVECVQLHSGDAAYGILHVHLPQETLEDWDYYFGIWVECVQWNWPGPV